MSDPAASQSDSSADYERFVQLLVAHEGRLRGFLRSLLPGWDAVEEVTQETSLVAWRKFSRFEPGSNFMAWAGTIARFEALKYLRTRQRDRLVFSDEVFDLLASEALEESETLARERRALDGCLGKLDAPQRELLQLSYQPGVRFHEIAAQTGKSATAFYKTIQRLRSALLDCIERELKQEPV